MARRFINFKDNELEILENSLLDKNNLPLLREIRDERRIRKHYANIRAKELENKPKIYCC